MPLPYPRRFIILTLLLTLFALPGLSAADADASQRPRFLYLLHLVDRLHTDAGWTKADEEIIARHFRYLKAATEQGKVIMVGRTLEAGDRTFGLVVFEADNADAAQAFAEHDPAVLGQVMTVEVRPFAVVLMRKL